MWYFDWVKKHNAFVNRIARIIYASMWYDTPVWYDFSTAVHPQEQQMRQMWKFVSRLVSRTNKKWRDETLREYEKAVWIESPKELIGW